VIRALERALALASGFVVKKGLNIFSLTSGGIPMPLSNGFYAATKHISEPSVMSAALLIFFQAHENSGSNPKRNVFIHKKGGEKLLDIVGNFRSAPTEGSVIACGRTAAQTTVQARQDPI